MTRGRSVSDSGVFPPLDVRLVDGCRISLDPEASTEERIDALMARQRARVSRGQLLRAGVSRSAIARRVQNTRLVAVHAGVYAAPHTEDLPLATETAALLASGEAAALSNHSGSTLWGLRPGTARPVHVTIPADRARRAHAGIRVHRSRILTATDVRIHQGLPVTSPAWTLLDVAAGLPDRDVERLLAEAMFVKRLVTRHEIEQILRRAGAHPGRARLARVAGSHTPPADTDSPPEEELLTLLRAAGLPEPRLRVWMIGYCVDMYWPGPRLAVEVDAYGTHGAPERFEADRRKDSKLMTRERVAVLRPTKLAIRERPLEVIATIARAIGQREVEFSGYATQAAASP